MLQAQEYDAVEQGIPYVSTHRRRIIAPDTRSRVAGYLTTAPEAAPGYRTDGVWVWSQSLADRARTAGVAPQEQLYIHLRQRSFLLPDRISSGVLAVAGEAIHGPPTVDPAPAWDWIHLGGYTGVDVSGYADAGRQLDALLRIRLREDGSVAESRYEPTGWGPGHGATARGRRRRARMTPITIGPASRTTDLQTYCSCRGDARMEMCRADDHQINQCRSEVGTTARHRNWCPATDTGVR